IRWLLHGRHLCRRNHGVHLVVIQLIDGSPTIGIGDLRLKHNERPDSRSLAKRALQRYRILRTKRARIGAVRAFEVSPLICVKWCTTIHDRARGGSTYAAHSISLLVYNQE